jgi:O-antigen ligase
MFSFFLGILLPLALGLGISSKKRLWYFLASLIFLADILTFSRGGYLGLAAGALALVFLFWQRVSGKQRIFIFSAILAVGFFLIVSGPVSSRFFSSFNLKEGSNSGRLEMWKKAMVVIRDNPLIGTGLGNYPLAVNPLATYRDPIYAHNTYLDIAVETGILTSLSWIILLISVIYSFWKKARKDMFYAGAAVSLIIFSVHSLVETGIYSPVVLTLVLIIIGINKPCQNEKMV